MIFRCVFNKAAQMNVNTPETVKRRLSLKRKNSTTSTTRNVDLSNDTKLTSRSMDSTGTMSLPPVTKRRPSSSTVPVSTQMSLISTPRKTLPVPSITRNLSGLKISATQESITSTATRPITPRAKTVNDSRFYLGSTAISVAAAEMGINNAGARFPRRLDTDVPIENASVQHTAASETAEINTLASAYSGKPRGLVGLDNLGNTCFMASILQCLSNSAPLTQYFLTGLFSKELNRRSISKGQLAEQYSELLQGLWTGGSFTSVRPSRLKQVIGMIASRFLGYEQQDAQEFLRFFLDGLHEDLNRVIIKPPYQELKDIDGESLSDQARRWWSYYAARNDSIAKDLFCGQLRSTVVCKKCGKKSTAFDPFWDLSLPIPKSSTMSVKRFGYFSKGTSLSSSKISINDCLKAFTDEEVRYIVVLKVCDAKLCIM